MLVVVFYLYSLIVDIYFVTNGTSTGNKIVYMARVTAGDKVLLDRNCHKSLMHVCLSYLFDYYY